LKIEEEIVISKGINRMLKNKDKNRKEKELANEERQEQKREEEFECNRLLRIRTKDKNR